METPHASTLADELSSLLLASGGRGMDAAEVLAHLRGRGTALLLALLSCIFLLPISIPGSSTVMGILMMVPAMTLMRGGRSRVPSWIRGREISRETLERLVAGLLRIHGWISRWVKPRYSRLARDRRLLRLHGVYVALMAIILAVPFPAFPFFGSNMIAAWPIFLLALGLLERDGVFVGLAYAWLIPFIAYWWILWVLFKEAFTQIFP
jgi:hypothetical protein